MPASGFSLDSSKSIFQGLHAGVRFIVFVIVRKKGVSLLRPIKDMIGLRNRPIPRLTDKLDTAFADFDSRGCTRFGVGNQNRPSRYGLIAVGNSDRVIDRARFAQNDLFEDRGQGGLAWLTGRHAENRIGRVHLVERNRDAFCVVAADSTSVDEAGCAGSHIGKVGAPLIVLTLLMHDKQSW